MTCENVIAGSLTDPDKKKWNLEILEAGKKLIS